MDERACCMSWHFESREGRLVRCGPIDAAQCGIPMLVAHRGPDFFKRFKIEFALFDGKRREIAFLRK